jgi:hypothetical protein
VCRTSGHGEVEILIEKIKLGLDAYQEFYEERYSLGKQAA